MSDAQATATTDFAGWAADLQKELGNTQVDVESYRRYHQADLSPAEAVAQERMDTDLTWCTRPARGHYC